MKESLFLIFRKTFFAENTMLTDIFIQLNLICSTNIRVSIIIA